MLVFTFLHLSAVAATGATGLESWKNLNKYSSLVMGSKTPALLAQIEKAAPGYRLTTVGYSTAAVLTYHAKKTVPVFGAGSRYGRQDDIITDWRQFQGDNLVVLSFTESSLAEYAPYFDAVELSQFSLHGANFYIVLGKGFDFQSYRQGILRTIRGRYYNVPNWLPAGSCYFCRKYFASDYCHNQ